jgi:hypothetical protein
MNLDELRDAHAKRDGAYKHYLDLRWLDKIGAHPIPATLDAIAGLMPHGWTVTCTKTHWYAVDPRKNPPDPYVSSRRTGDELTDRARLAWLAWEAEAKGAAQ